MRNFVILPLLFWIPLAIPTARAATRAQRAQSLALEKEGKRLYGQQNYAEAVEKFKAALKLHKKVTLYFNLAQSCRLAGKDDDALKWYRTFLPLINSIRKLPPARKKTLAREVQGHIKDLERQIAQREKAQREKAAAARRKAEEAKRQAQLRADRLARLQRQEENRGFQGLTRHWWFWTGVGATAFFTLSTASFGVLALQKNGDWKDSANPDDRDAALRYQDFADISLGMALAAGITTGVLTWLHLRNPTPAKTPPKSTVMFHCHTRFCGIFAGFSF